MPTLTAEQIAGYAKAAGFPPDQIATATAVALAESGGRTDAVNRANRNGSVDYGVWQINTIHGNLLNQGDKFDPAANARMAHTVWRQAGGKWTPWSVYKSGRYTAFMPRATLAAARPDAGAAGPVAGAAVPGQGSTGDVPLGSTTAQGQASVTAGTSFLDLAYQILSGSFWLRIGAFMLGGALMFISLWQLTGAGDTIVQLAGGVAKKAVLKR